MAKMRIHELAKELGIPSKDVMAYLDKIGLGEKYSTSSNSIEEADQKKVAAHFTGGEAKPAAPAQKAAAETQKPAAEAQKATAPAQKPAAEAQKPAASAQKQAAEAQKPAAEVQKPAAAAQKPAAAAQKPAAETQKPAAGAQKPAASAQTQAAPAQKAAAAEGQKSAQAARKPAQKPAAADAGKAPADGEERPKKKSNWTAVYNPQNSTGGNNRQKSRVYNSQDGNRRRRAPGEKPPRRAQRPQDGQGRPQGQRRPDSAKRPDQGAAARAAEFAARQQEKEAQKAKQAAAARKAEEASASEEAVKEAKAAAAQTAEQTAAGQTKAVQPENTRAAEAAGTAKTAAAQERPDAARRTRPQKDGGSREAGRTPDRSGRTDTRSERTDRSGRTDAGSERTDRSGQSRTREDGRRTRDERSDRRQSGDRSGSYGKKPEKTEKSDRSVQKGGQGNRSDGSTRSGNRYGNKNKSGYQKEQRPGDNRGSRRVDAGAAQDGGKGGRNDRNKSKKKTDYKKTDYNKKNNGRNQERYVNLEKKSGFKKKNAAPQTAAEKEAREEIRSIKLPEYITVHDLADKMKITPSEIIKKLFLQGTVLTMNQEIDYEKAEEIALQFNCIAEPEEKVDVIAELLAEEEEDPDSMVPRPPVVCVMGHVDHGKTSLLDAIRETHVTDREAGGITQHIGASVAKINDCRITFLDTPGHEAFTAMRMRGANSTDIAILVVAADDGIMPQTIEAINHAKAAGIEIIVAINKIDKPNANIEKVKQGLAERELVPEDWGGSTICVPVSAKTREGIDELLEMVLLTADMLELKANPKRRARGLVIEAKLDKGRGAVATVLVQKGTLKAGDPVAAGSCYGKVRAMSDHKGRRVREAGPSTPVEIFGLNSVPGAGEVLMSFDNEKEARTFAEAFVSKDKERLLEETRARRNLDDIFSQIQAGDLKELDLIVKADVQGSAEAVRQSLEKLTNEEVVVKVIHAAVGNISESDVSLASASNAVIIGFNVKVDAVAKSIADHENVDIRLYSVIYQAIDDVENAMKGMLEPLYEERVIGHVEIRQLFKASGVGTIAGSYVLDGSVERGCKVRISRGDEQIFEGDLASLKRFKDDVKEVKAGYECGLVFAGFNDIAVDDIVEAYKIVEVPRS